MNRRTRVYDLLISQKGMSEKLFAKTMTSLTDHERDLLVKCKSCGARSGYECFKTDPGIVHFGRRLLRLIKLPERIFIELSKMIDVTCHLE